MNVRRLLRGLKTAPPFSLRQQAVSYSLGGLILMVGAAVEGSTLGAVASAVAVLVLFGLALVLQHHAETSGAVEREQQRQEEVWAKRAAWSPGRQLAFSVFVALVFVAIIAKGVLTILF